MTPQPSLRARALKYLAAREHSRVELLRKLGPHAESPEQLAALLDDLERQGLLSAQRFAESVVHRKASRMGAARIKAELAQHRLPDDLARPLLAQLQATELQRALAVWQRRFGQVPATPQEQVRQQRFLAARGFGAEVIRRVLRLGAQACDD